MTAILNLSIPVRQRLANIKAGKPYRNELWGAYTAQPNRPAVYYVAPCALRCVGFADELVRGIRHTGWYTDREFPDDGTMRGVVYALPAKDGQRRLVAGYHENEKDDAGATLFFDEIFGDEKDAARMADEHARVAADEECDYQEEERARIAEEEAEEARLDNLAECHPPLHVE